jgi:hypothetical protein
MMNSRLNWLVTATRAPLQPRPLDDLHASARAVEPGRRPEAIRAAAAAFRAEFARHERVDAVRTIAMLERPVPARLALAGPPGLLGGRVTVIDRMLVVCFRDFGGARRILVWEPALADSASDTRLYTHQDEHPGRGLARSFAARELCRIDGALARYGIAASDVDLVAFGDLRGHDLRRLAGTTRPLGNEHQPRRTMFEAARFVVQRRELEAARDPHPMQAPWYVESGADDVDEGRLLPVNGDVELGAGVALVSTPGLSVGHQSLALLTREGIWVVSSNGVANDCWQPLLSKIPGVRRSAEVERREAMLPGAGYADALDLYDSLVLERSLADASARDPRWLAILPHRELARMWRRWPAVPTFSHGPLNLGSLRAAG